MATEKDIHLDEDCICPNKLKYAIISFCSSKSRQRLEDDSKVALRIRGGFSTVEEAMGHVKRLDRKLDAYVCELYKWTLIGNVTPDMDVEDHLVDMIKCHKKRNTDAKEKFKERKELIQKEGMDALPEEHKDIVDTQQDTMENDAPTLMDIEPIKESDPVMDNGINFSDTDIIKVDGLHYAILSVVERDPEYQTLKTPNGVFGIKIRGIFETKSEAEAHINDKLSKLDDDFDMLIADMYKFLSLPVDHDDIEDTRYREEYLQDLFTTYKKSQEEARAHQKERGMEEVLEEPVHPTEIKAIEEGAPSGSGT